MLDVSFVIFSSVIIDLKYVYVFVSSPGFHEGGEATISGSFVLDDGGDGLEGAAGPLHHFQNQEMGLTFSGYWKNLSYIAIFRESEKCTIITLDMICIGPILVDLFLKTTFSLSYLSRFLSWLLA